MHFLRDYTRQETQLIKANSMKNFPGLITKMTYKRTLVNSKKIKLTK